MCTVSSKRIAPSVLLKLLYNMSSQLKENVLLYTLNWVTIPTNNIQDFYHPTYTTTLSEACWDIQQFVSPLELPTNTSLIF